MGTLHFRASEFACNCCRQERPNSHLLAVLELVRHHFGKRVYVESGYRCSAHNKKVGGAPSSQHLIGTAADIVVEDVLARDVYAFLNKVFPDSYGLGSYTSFTHIDVRSIKARW